MTLLPPPWGTSAIDRTLTPIVAQSSVEASLNEQRNVAILRCDTGTGVVLLPPPPPPQAASSAAAVPSSRNLDALGNHDEILLVMKMKNPQNQKFRSRCAASC